MNPGREALVARWYELGWYGTDTIATRLARTAQERPTTRLRWFGDRGETSLTIGELDLAARRVAGGLASAGLRPGDVLAVQMQNCVEFAVTYAAAMYSGLVYLPIVHYYGRAEVDFILRQSGARGYVVPRRLGRFDYLALAASLEGADERVVIVLGDEGSDGHVLWNDLARAEPCAAPHEVHPDDVCVLVYTSGTTSAPKGVQHTSNSLLANVRGTNETWSGGGPDGRPLQILPAGHVAGVMGLNNAFFHGGDALFMEAWDPRRAVELIEAEHVTGTSGSAFFVRGLLDAAAAAGAGLRSLRQITLGAAGVPPQLVREADARGLKAIRSYGSSEQLVVTAARITDDVDTRANTDGAPIGVAELSIVDEDWNHLQPGTPGEIVMRGPTQFVGYLDQTLDTEVFDDAGWFRTGDVGVLDEHGCLTITDRVKDIIIRGGENLSSLEIEEALVRMAEVADVAVVAAPDPRYGELVAAVIVARGDLDLASIGRHFTTLGMAPQKTPERLLLVDELPRNAAGKVNKVELRQRFRVEVPT